MEFSKQQIDVFGWVTGGAGNALIVAVAGSGKTTTLLEAVDLMTGSVAIAAYNRKIADELTTKLTARAAPPGVRAGTFHSFGFAAWRRVAGRVTVDERRKWDAINEEHLIPEAYRGFVKKAVSLAKQRGFGFLEAIEDVGAWRALVDHFDLEYELAENGRDLSEQTAQMVEEGITLAIRALHDSIHVARELIDYDDMIYMPLQANAKIWENDWLLVDEAQDTNPARRALAKRMLKPGGRAIFVGDPAQAIYGFTGADNDSLAVIKAEFSAVYLPLTITYRCPKAVVALAQKWVTHIQAAETAPQGSVSSVSLESLLVDSAKLTADDAILCRNTAPLVDLAYQLIRRNVACHVEGKDIGRGLMAIVNRWKVKGLTALADKLIDWREKRVARLLAQGKELAAASVDDTVQTLLVLIDAARPQGGTVDTLRANIEKLFGDSNDPRAKKTLTLCTVHKSKGMEWSTVYLLGRDRYMPSPFARQAWQAQQEINLMYVAVTRAQSALIDVVVPVTERRKPASSADYHGGQAASGG